jgi:predicted nucleotidyltransferase
MRTSLDHLPVVQQDELHRVRELLLTEFARAISSATQPWKKGGKVLKIVLFGSYARDDWVDEPANGYQSDYDLLVIVSHPDLTDIADYWYAAEDLIQRDPAIARPVNVIVHTLDEVNQALSRGEYFWVDIARDGIVLYERPGSALATPRPLTAADAYEMAAGYARDWQGKVDSVLREQSSIAARAKTGTPRLRCTKRLSARIAGSCLSARCIFRVRTTSSFCALSPRARSRALSRRGLGRVG